MELEEEIAHDLWLDAEERVAAGMSRVDAARASRKDFGNVALIKEAAREAWTWRTLEILAQDLRYAARTLGRSPAFAVTAIATLALGIGVNSATFTIFDQIAFRPLPIKDGNRIVSVYETFHGRFDRKVHGNIHMLSYPEFLNYQAHNREFAEVAAYAEVRRLTLAGAQPEAVSGMLVTDHYFSVLGAGVALGRTFRDEESSSQAVAVLSDGYWRRRFGGDPEILGRTIRLNQTVFTIVGVIAPGFVGTTTTSPDIWLPLSAQPQVMVDLPPGEPQNFGLQSVDLSLDVNVLAYTLLLSIATSVMFGLIPALQATTLNLSGALKDEGTMPGLSMHKTTLRSRLISAQVAVCCILLVGAGLLVRGLMNLNSLDPGFRVNNVLVTDVVLPFPPEDKTRAAAFYRDLLSRIDAQTGGQSALAAVPPFHGVRIVRTVASDGGASADSLHEANSNIVSGDDSGSAPSPC